MPQARIDIRSYKATLGITFKVPQAWIDIRSSEAEATHAISNMPKHNTDNTEI